MLAGEMTLAVWERLARLLVATELDVLATFPIGVRTQQEGIRERRVERRLPVPVSPDARENRLEFLEEGLAVAERVRRRGLALERRQRDAAAGVVDEDPGLVGLATGHIPGVLVTGVGIARAIADPDRCHPCSRRVIPVPRVELELEFGVRAIAELGDGRDLQLVEVGFAVVQGPQ